MGIVRNPISRETYFLRKADIGGQVRLPMRLSFCSKESKVFDIRHAEREPA
jgi:hypothetical protein